ncbi:MAG: hypothetical protein ABFD96_25390 [Armatimonadia bacterium]
MALTDIKYVTNGGWGTGIARPLTAPEADTNIHALRDAIQTLIDNPVEGVGVSNIAVSGRQLTFYMTDGTTFGPFLLPVAYPRYRGDWLAASSYAVMDIVYVSGYGTYIVAADHTAAAAFDPDASNSEGDYYVQIAGDPNLTATVLELTENVFYATSAYASRYVRCAHAAGTTVSVYDDVPPNTEIHFRQASTGPINFVAASGATLNIPGGHLAETDGIGATVTIKHIGGGVWDVFGALKETSY